jgi:CheY-like chemotaxis protein
MGDLFVDELRDPQNAESQLNKANPRMANATTAAGDSDAYERSHLAEEVHATRPNGDAVKCKPGGHRSLRIVVVDDNRAVAESFHDLLKRWGHVVRWTCDGDSALELISTDRPDVVLLDIAMPGRNGCEVAREVRRQPRFNETLLIAVSGYGDEQHRLDCAQAGFDHCVVKPIEFATLAELLLARHAPLAESSGTPLVTEYEWKRNGQGNNNRSDLRRQADKDSKVARGDRLSGGRIDPSEFAPPP